MKGLAALSLGAWLAGGAPAQAQEIAAPKPAADGFFYETTTLAPHVTLIFRPDPLRLPSEGNVTVIEQSKGLVVIDAGGAPAGGRRLVAQIRRISPKPVRYLVYTHWHGDHNLGAPAFRDAFPGVKVIATEGTDRALRGTAAAFYDHYGENFLKGVLEPARRQAADPALDLAERRQWAQLRDDAPLIAKAYDEVGKLTLPDVTFKGRMDLPDPVAPVQLLFLGRGNTDGDAIAWAPRQKVLASGDLVVSPYPFGTESYPAEWIAVLRKLKAYPFKVLVPGHGAPQRDRSYIDRLIALIEDVQGTVRTDPDTPVDALARKLEERAPYASFAPDAWSRRFFRNYFLTGMITNVRKEAKGEPIVQ